MLNVNTLYVGDALQYLSLMDDKTADLTILDPNYEDWEYLLENGLLDEVVRITKDEGNIICFTKQPFDFNLRNAINPYFRHEFIWSFSNGGAWVSNRKPLISFQKFYWLVKSNNFFYNPRTGLPYGYKTKNLKRRTKKFKNYDVEGRYFVKSEEGIFLRDHLHFEKSKTPKNTPYIPSKPLKLMEIIVKCFCPENGIVLDPFSGAGTIGVACKNNHRNFICIERNTDLIPYIENKLYDNLVIT